MTDSHIPSQALLAERRQWLFVFLAGLFFTNAITAELISNKLIEIPISFDFFGLSFGPFITIIGILPWPVVFLITDLMNEFYGKKAVQRVSWIGAALIAYSFFIVLIALQVPAKEIPNSGLSTNEQFNAVFGQAPWIIVGSIAAFLLSQLLDASLFQWIKQKTGNRWVALRSTGSTVVSQCIDSYVVLFIGFVLPGKMGMSDYLTIAPTNYVLKLMIAIALTPLVYVGHAAVRRYLRESKMA
jgi:queuosine precursor transporter